MLVSKPTLLTALPVLPSVVSNAPAVLRLLVVPVPTLVLCHDYADPHSVPMLPHSCDHADPHSVSMLPLRSPPAPEWSRASAATGRGGAGGTLTHPQGLGQRHTGRAQCESGMHGSGLLCFPSAYAYIARRLHELSSGGGPRVVLLVAVMHMWPACSMSQLRLWAMCLCIRAYVCAPGVNSISFAHLYLRDCPWGDK